MEVKITNKLAVILTVLSSKLLWAILLFVVSIIVVALTLPDKYSSLDSILAWFKAAAIPLIFLLYHALNAYVYSNKTKLQLKESSIDLHSGNIFTNNSFSFTFPQIGSVNIVQSFWQKIFSICQINILQEGGLATRVWGFSMNDAQSFVSEFSKNFKVKIAK